MKNRSQRYGINRPRPRHGILNRTIHNYAKYEMCHNKIMVICIKQSISNI